MMQPFTDSQVSNDGLQRWRCAPSPVRQLVHQGARPGPRSRHERSLQADNDPRVTPVGACSARRASTAAAAGNVLRGAMSLVGPRPPLRITRAVQALASPSRPGGQAGNHRTLAGVGAQPTRPSTRWALRPPVRPGTRSLWADLKILLATPAAVISGKGPVEAGGPGRSTRSPMNDYLGIAPDVTLGKGVNSQSSSTCTAARSATKRRSGHCEIRRTQKVGRRARFEPHLHLSGRDNRDTSSSATAWTLHQRLLSAGDDADGNLQTGKDWSRGNVGEERRIDRIWGRLLFGRWLSGARLVVPAVSSRADSSLAS